MASDKYKDLEKIRQSDKVLKDKVFAVANNPKYDGYQRGLASMVYKFLIRSQEEVLLKMKFKKKNQGLANELHKTIIRN